MTALLDPQVVIVDGNGSLHPRRCGVATLLGVTEGLRTLGIAKTLHVFQGVDMHAVLTRAAACLHESFAAMPLHVRRLHDDNEVEEEEEDEVSHDPSSSSEAEAIACAAPFPDSEVVGLCVRVGSSVARPLFVSAGHRLSHESALHIARAVLIHHNPEPVRQADLASREWVRVIGRLRSER